MTVAMHAAMRARGRQTAMLGILSALVATASAQTPAQIAAWGASAESLTNVDGWSLVRYLPAGAATWHFATDNLAGTHVYAQAQSSNGGWSSVFPTGFDELFIASADFSKWVHFPRESIASQFGTQERLVYRASSVAYPDSFLMYNSAADGSHPIISCVRSVTDLNADAIYVEASNSGSSPAKGSLVFVRTRPPCELRGEAEQVTGMRDWMQIKHIPRRISGGPTTYAFGDTFQGTAGNVGTVTTGTRPAVLAAADLEWAVSFVPGPLSGSEEYYLFLFRLSEQGQSNVFAVYSAVQLRLQSNNGLRQPYMGTMSQSLGMSYNAMSPSRPQDPIIAQWVTFYKENGATDDGGRQPFSTAVFHKRSADPRSTCCAVGSFAESSAWTVGVSELKRAVALVPGSSHIPRLASMRGRDLVETRSAAAADMPTYHATAGPNGGGVVRFDRAAQQFLNGGTQVFHFHRRNGFTAVALVKFTGALSDAEGGSNENVFAFGQPETDQRTVVVHRDGLTGMLVFSVFQSFSPCTVKSITAIAQDAWVEIAVWYDASNQQVRIKVNTQAERSSSCSIRGDRTLDTTTVGRSHLGSSPFSGDIAGLFAVDELLSFAQRDALFARMRAGQDTLSSCTFCGAGETAPGGSLVAAACEAVVCHASASLMLGTGACACNPGFTGAPGGTCSACGPGKFKVAGGV